MKYQNGRPSKTARRIYAWRDLPAAEKTETFLIHDPDKEPRSVTIRGKRAQVLKGLIRSPLYAASYARIGDHVWRMKQDDGIDIETLMYKNDSETDREKYGVYELRSTVTRVGGGAV